MVQVYRKTVRLSQFSSANLSLTADEFTEVYRLRVPAKQVQAWGGGAIINGVDDRETFKLDLKDGTSTSLVGDVRIKIADPNKANDEFVKDFITEDLNTGVKLGVRNDLAVGEYAYLVIEAKTSSGTFTVDPSNSTGSIPVTIQLL